MAQVLIRSRDAGFVTVNAKKTDSVHALLSRAGIPFEGQQVRKDGALVNDAKRTKVGTARQIDVVTLSQAG